MASAPFKFVPSVGEVVPFGSRTNTYHIFNRGTAVFSHAKIHCADKRFFADFITRCAMKNGNDRKIGRMASMFAPVSKNM
jgi:hypothetical protein